MPSWTKVRIWARRALWWVVLPLGLGVYSYFFWSEVLSRPMVEDTTADACIRQYHGPTHHLLDGFGRKDTNDRPYQTP